MLSDPVPSSSAVGWPRLTSWPGPPSGAAAMACEHLTCLDLGRLVTSLFINKTKNEKVGQKGLSTQHQCRLVLVLNLVPLPYSWGSRTQAAQVCRGALSTGSWASA